MYKNMPDERLKAQPVLKFKRKLLRIFLLMLLCQPFVSYAGPVNMQEVAVIKPLLEVLCGVIDPVNGFAYFGSQGPAPLIAKVRLSDFANQGYLQLAQGDGPLSTAIID